MECAELHGDPYRSHGHEPDRSNAAGRPPAGHDVCPHPAGQREMPGRGGVGSARYSARVLRMADTKNVTSSPAAPIAPPTSKSRNVWPKIVDVLRTSRTRLPIERRILSSVGPILKKLIVNVPRVCVARKTSMHSRKYVMSSAAATAGLM